MPAIAYIALGSNLGDREKNLKTAFALMQERGIRIRRVSSFYRTAPYGVTDQPDFLNAACEAEWDGDPESLLHTLLRIELDMGRERKRHWGERNIDLDLILFGDAVIHSRDLTLPHPDMANRSFVLEPLAEIAPRAVHPFLHRTIGELWEALKNRGDAD